MEEILEKNLQSLKKYQPQIYNKVNLYIKGEYKPIDNSVERILLAKNDELIINMLVICSGKEYTLCDSEDPINQSYAWIDRYIDPSNKADIIFGMGLGFHLEVLLTSFKNKKVFIVEPNIELFYQTLQVRNLELIIKKSEIFLDESIDYVISKIHPLFWNTDDGDIQVEPFEVYGEMFGELWDELRSKFIKHAENFNVDIATRRRFGSLWVYNNVKNAEKLCEASNADGLVGSFKGIPGILVSAGPSLAKNIHLINELKDKCVVMAAGTAVNILENHGIEPHFMVGIDASKQEADIHKKVKSKEIHFLYSNQVSTASIEAYKGPKFFMNYTVDIYTAEFLKFAGLKSQMFISGPSVANTCFDILLRMGCNPIIIVGQDLAFTSGSNYAGEQPGTTINSTFDNKDNRYILTKDINGEDVYTEASYISMKNWFEACFEKVSKNVEIINATEGGLNIEYAKNCKLADVIKNYAFKKQDIARLIGEIHEGYKFSKSINDKLKDYKAFILTEIEKLHNQADRQKKDVDLIKRGIYHPSKGRMTFNKKVEHISELSDNVMVSPIYNSILKNLIEIDFYIIKMELDRATKNLSGYNEVKDIFINALEQQNKMLIEKLELVKEIL